LPFSEKRVSLAPARERQSNVSIANLRVIAAYCGSRGERIVRIKQRRTNHIDITSSSHNDKNDARA
jgi:hypothetical protein